MQEQFDTLYQEAIEEMFSHILLEALLAPHELPLVLRLIWWISINTVWFSVANIWEIAI